MSRDAGFADSPEYSKREEIIKTHNAEKAAKDKIDKLNYYRLRMKYERK